MMRKNLCLLILALLVLAIPAKVWAQPAFDGGPAQALNACSGTPLDLDPYLSVTDPATGLTETFSSITILPLQGSISGLPTSVPSGTSVSPTGVTYTPNAGASGPDVFEVQVSNGTLTAITIFTVTINTAPTITLGANPTVNSGATTANLPYTGTSGAPITYNITWSTAATMAGFSNVSGNPLPASPIPLSVPALATPSVYTGILTVENASNCTSNGVSFSVTIAGAPIVTTEPATIITPTTAVLNGLVDDNGDNTSVSFDYGTSPTLAGATNVPGSPASVPGGTGSTSVTATLGSLTANTVYYFRVNGTNAINTTNGAILSFTSADNPPSFVNGNPQTLNLCQGASSTDISSMFAMTDPDAGQTETFTVLTGPFNGSLTGFPTSFVVTSGINTPTGISYMPAAGYNGPDSFKVQISDGIDTTSTTVLITISAPPTITLGADPAITAGSTTANLPYTGTSGSPVNYSITWDPAASLAGFTDVMNSTLPVSPISLAIPASAPQNTYNGTITVENAINCTSAPVSFSVTIVNAPSVVTMAATSVTVTSATLNGTVNDNGAATNVTFAYGTSPTLAGATTVTATPAVVAAGSGVTPVLYNVTGLSGGTTYYFMAIGTNAGGFATGAILSFTTDFAPTFVNGGSQNSAVCENSGATNVSALFTIHDADAGQTETFSVTTAPSHGALSGLPTSVISNGGNIAPTGITYTPTTGYAGSDAYTITVNDGNGGSATTVITVTVNPTPNVVATPPTQTVCNNTTTDVAFTSSVTGTTYNWTNNNTATGLGASGSGNISFTSANSSSVAATSIVTVTPSANGCAGTAGNASITVTPTPSVTATPDQTVCNNSTQGQINFSGTGTTYTWTNNNTTIGLANSGTGNIPAFIAVNNSSVAVTATVTVTPSIGACTGTAKEFTITVYPTPNVVSTPLTQTVCNGNLTQNVAFTGSVTGTTYTWVNNNTSTGLVTTTGSGDILPFIGTNSGTVTAASIVTVTPTANGCPGTTEIVTISVNPTPNMAAPASPSFCNGTTATENFTATTSGTSPVTFTWTNSNTSIGEGASGTGDLSFTAIDTSSVNPVTASFTVTPSIGTCVGAPQNFTITVDPAATVTATPAAQTDCNNTASTPIVFSTGVTGPTTYTWTNNNTSIGLPASGSGSSIGTFTATNSGTTPITGIITIIPTSNGCVGTAKTATVIVTPSPVLAFVPDQTVCSNTTDSVDFTSNFASATYSWTNNNTTIGLPSSGNGNIAPFTVMNSTSVAATATITVTPSFGGCQGMPQSFTITANPVPVLSTATFAPPQCDSLQFVYGPNSNTTGINYAWTRAAIAGLNNDTASSGIDTIREYLSDTTGSDITVHYVYTLTAGPGTCSNTQNVFVVVAPKPVLTNSVTSSSLCSGSTFSFAPTSNTDAGTSYTWTRDTIPGNGDTSGTGNINEVLVDPTASPYLVTYIYTLTANGCSNTQDVTATILPTPTLNNAITYFNLCDSTAFSFTPGSNTTPVSYAWTRAAVPGISNPAESGTGAINDTLVNTSPNAVLATYVYTLTAFGCTNTQDVFANVYPTPALSNTSLTESPICDSTLFTFIDSSATSGATFSWTRAAVAGISNPAASDTGNISEILVNTTNMPVVVTYIDSVMANSCAANVQTVTVTVNPNPQLTSTLSATVCNNTLFTYTPTSNVAVATFTWERLFDAGIASPADTGTGGISETLDNISYHDIDVQYLYTVTAYGCSNTATLNVTVHETPQLTSSLADTVCSGQPFVYAPAADSGIVFTWSRDSVTNVTPATGSGSDSIKETLSNSTTHFVNVTYVYTLSIGGFCPATEDIHVAINPAPPVPTITTESPASLCSGTLYQNFGASGLAPAGLTYSWGAVNADVYATGNTKQYSLINFTTPGVAVVVLSYNVDSTKCSSEATYSVTVGNTESDTPPTVIYSEGNLMCLQSNVDTYQWGYDDANTLDSTIAPGQINQNYTVTLDTANYAYWVMTVHNGCMQKAYFNIPNPGNHRHTPVVNTQSNANNSTDVKLYPNPTNDVVNVNIISNVSGEVQVEVLNLMGQKLYTVQTVNNNAQINVAALPAGVYLVDCYRDGVKINAARFVKN